MSAHTLFAGENEGRLSGSLSWRLSREETSSSNLTSEMHKEYIFIPTEEEVERKEMIVKYSCAKDLYIRDSFTNDVRNLVQLKSGLFSSKNVFRKHEKDWRMFYVARTGELK